MLSARILGAAAAVLYLALAFHATTLAYRVLPPIGAVPATNASRPPGTSGPSLGEIVKGNKIIAYGRVAECRGGSTYLIQLENSEKKVLCELGGMLCRKRKLITVNARVKIEVHLLAPNKGRIVERIDGYDELFSPKRDIKDRGPATDQKRSRDGGSRE